MFEWDDNKNRINIAKHGIPFEIAKFIFQNRIVQFPDTRKDYGETRIAALGQVDGRVLLVIYTWRGSQKRLISARMAKKKERELYYEKAP